MKKVRPLSQVKSLMINGPHIVRNEKQTKRALCGRKSLIASDEGCFVYALPDDERVCPECEVVYQREQIMKAVAMNDDLLTEIGMSDQELSHQAFLITKGLWLKALKENTALMKENIALKKQIERARDDCEAGC